MDTRGVVDNSLLLLKARRQYKATNNTTATPLNETFPEKDIGFRICTHQISFVGGQENNNAVATSKQPVYTFIFPDFTPL